MEAVSPGPREPDNTKDDNVRVCQPRDLRVELQARLALGLCELELARLELADVLHADLPAEVGEDVVLGRVDNRR